MSLLIKNFKVFKCVAKPLSPNEMVFYDDITKKQSRSIHLATLQAYTRGQTRIFVYFYNENEPDKRFLEERIVSRIGGVKYLNYAKVEEQIEQEDLIAHLKDYMLQAYYREGATLDFYGTRSKDPIPYFKDEKGKLLKDKETTTEKLLEE